MRATQGERVARGRSLAVRSGLGLAGSGIRISWEPCTVGRRPVPQSFLLRWAVPGGRRSSDPRKMILEANDLKPGTTVRADVCIAGAGAAGITLALALSGLGFEVVLLEGGGRRDETDSQALYAGSMSGLHTWELDSLRFRLLGGSTSRWAGWCRPLEPHDFAARHYVSSSGWPLTFEELIPYYKRAHRWVELADYEWSTEAIRMRSGRPVLESPGGRLQTHVFQYSPPTRFGARYQPAMRSAENLRVYLHANLVELPLEPNLEQLAHFECATLQGGRFTVEARAYVLALGGIENARLLLASNQQIEDGIANSSGAVGRYFMEHPHYVGASKLALAGNPDLTFYDRHTVALPDGSNRRDVQVAGVLALRPEVLAEEGLLDFTVAFGAVAPDPGATGDLDAHQVRSLLGQSGQSAGSQLVVRAEQSPRKESRITLRRGDTDALGLPRLDLNWQIHPDDDRALRRGLEILGSELAAAGLGRLWTSTQAGRLSGTALPGAHHMGTTRMSEQAEAGVVNANCRCHDVENLYIAGSSVFTTGGAANPTLTIVALAERLATHLQERLS